jgi:hypothetical protein
MADTTNQLATAVSAFGAAAKAAFTNPAIVGEPEEQPRNPLDTLVRILLPIGCLLRTTEFQRDQGFAVCAGEGARSAVY